MYECFTELARKVLQHADEEAQRFRHEYISTEHILLGLVRTGTGVAVDVLRNLDIDPHSVTRNIEKIVQPGPDAVGQGKKPQTPRAKKVIEYAVEEARNFNHDYVDTEHLLLGLLREGEAVASQVLTNLGVRLRDVRNQVLTMLGQQPQTEIVDLSIRSSPVSAESLSDIQKPSPGGEKAMVNHPGNQAMPITFSCTSCEAKLRTKPELAGKRVKCPKCGQATQAPGEAPVNAAPEPRMQPAQTAGTHLSSRAAKTGANRTSHRVIRVVAEATGVNQDQLLLDTDLKEDIGFDDLDFVELIQDLETEFDVIISDEDAERFCATPTIANLIDCIDVCISLEDSQSSSGHESSQSEPGVDEGTQQELPLSSGEVIYYRDESHANCARCVAAALSDLHLYRKMGFQHFLVRQIGRFISVSFTVANGAWEDGKLLEAFHELRRLLASQISLAGELRGFDASDLVLGVCDSTWRQRTEIRSSLLGNREQDRRERREREATRPRHRPETR